MPSIREKLAKKRSKLASRDVRDRQRSTALPDFQEGSFYYIEINLIGSNPYQPRQYFDPAALAELSRSIKQKGVIQPIIVRRDEDGHIFLVAGERRLRAAKQAGLEKIPAVLTKGNPIEISLIENLQRENLNPVEEAEALARMTEEYNYTQEQLALAIGKARTTITETLSLNKLPESIRNECRQADLYSRRLLVEVAKQKTIEEKISLFEEIKKRGLKSDDVRRITRKRSKKPGHTPTAIALDQARRLCHNLEKIDLDSSEDTEILQLVIELKNLRERIDSLIG